MTNHSGLADKPILTARLLAAQAQEGFGFQWGYKIEAKVKNYITAWFIIQRTYYFMQHRRKV